MTGEGAGPTHRGPSLVSVFHQILRVSGIDR